MRAMPTIPEQTIQQLASNAGSRSEFFDGFLRHVASEHQAIGGLAWNCTNMPFQPICQVHDPKFDTLRMSFSESEHQALLRQAKESDDPLLIQGKEPEGVGAEGRIPQPKILLAKIATPSSVEIVEFFFRHDEEHAGLRQKVVEVTHLCRAAAGCEFPDYQSLHAPMPNAPGVTGVPGSPLELARQMASKKIPAEALDAYVHSLHGSLDPKETARQISNELRRILDCDRVSVVRASGRKFKITAISGQPSVNRRSNTVSLLRRVAEKVLPTRQEFWYPADGEFAPQIRKPLDQYLAIAATRTMVVVPFFDRRTDLPTGPDAPKVEPKLIGGVVIEHCNEQWDQSKVSESVEIATRHAGDAFRNSYQHRNLFLYPVWKWIGKSKVLFAARHIAKTTAAVIALGLLTLALIFLPADFRMNCTGQLVPVVRQNIFPHVPGVVDEVLVAHGDQVAEGDPLLKMVSLDLDYQATELQGQIDELRQMIRSTQASRLNRENQEEAELQKQSLQGQKAELKSMQKNLDLLNEKQSRLTINSPIAGQVMTWDVKDQLKQRPVTVNDRLLEIAKVDGQWQLELHLPDRKVGHFLSADRESDDPLEVEFILAADPSKSYRGHVIEIGHSTEVNSDNEQVLKVKVAIDSEDIDIRQSKSGVSAYIECGERSLGYVWFHPVIEFFQSKVFFPLW
jgi:biotin carboxyl carrier protein